MEPVPQSIEEHQQTAVINLPRLGHQPSLRDLIEEDLQSRDNSSVEMAALLSRRDEAADSDGTTIAVPTSEAQDAGTGVKHRILLGPANNHERSQSTTVADSRPISKLVEICRKTIMRRRATSEQPKVVHSYKRREILRQILLFHLAPVSINFALMGLYIRQVLWTPPWPTTNILNTLQFAAKVHETLMVASLASILLHHIRYKLLSSDQGVPLGLVTSPFRLLDLTYLWSQEFSAAWWGEKGISKVISIGLHIYLFILAATLGPASAICMLPRLEESQLADSIAKAPFKDSGLQIYVGGRLSDFYPQRITRRFIPEACDYGNFSQPQTNTCPRHGLSDILRDWLPADVDTATLRTAWNYFVGLNFTVQRNENLALPPRTIGVNSRMQNFGNHETVTDATTSSDVILRFTDLLVKYHGASWLMMETSGSRSDGFRPRKGRPAKFTLYPGQRQPQQSPSSWKEPLVSALCSMQGGEINESGSLQFAFDQCLDSTCGPKYGVSLDSRYLPSTFNDTGMGFVDVSNLEITPSFTPSAAFIYTHFSNTTLCVIKTNWVETTLTAFVPWISSSDLLRTWQTADPDWIHKGGNWFNETNPTQIIHLDLEWLAALDNGTGRYQKGDFGFFGRLRQACLDWLDLKDNIPKRPGKQLSTACMTHGISLGITEGLSKTLYHFDVHALRTTEGRGEGIFGPPLTLSSWTDLDRRPAPPLSTLFDLNWTSSTLSPSEIRETSTRLDFVISEELYGYRFHGVTITLAFIVLFLYVATVFMHILIMSFGTSWSSRAWTSLGEFLVLAIQSPIPPSVLDNTGGGVKSSSTWKARTSVQELEGGKRVGITVQELGRPDAETGPVSKVRPDCEYS